MAVIGFTEQGSATLRMEIPCTVEQALRSLRDDASFRAAWSRALVEQPFVAFRWEMPALTGSTLGDPFEAVIVNSPSLQRRQDPSAFAEHFVRASGASSITVPNLRGDALLIIPRPEAETTDYCHLGSFLRSATATQCDALWAAVGSAALTKAGMEPLWMNTAGGGVPWLHVRLDSRPKYYVHTPYRRPKHRP